MNRKITLSPLLMLALVCFGSVLARAADSIHLIEELHQAAKTFSEQDIPSNEIAKAKAVVFLDYAEGAIGIGVKSGAGLGMKLNHGKANAPVFLDISGGSIGFQLGGGKSKMILLLMTDESLAYITGGKTSFEGFAGAVVDKSSVSTSTLSGGKNPSILVYGSKTGGGFSAAIGGINISPDSVKNQQVYGGVYPGAILDIKISQIKNKSVRQAAENFAKIIMNR